MAVQYLLMGVLKTLYPKETDGSLRKISDSKKRLFCCANGNKKIYHYMLSKGYVAWKMIEYQEEEREQFKKKRKKYLIY